MIYSCIHGRTASSQDAVECLDCEELSALHDLETWERRSGVCDKPCEHHVCRRLRVIDEVRRRKGSPCIHGRTAATSQAVECLDCEELAALRALENTVRSYVARELADDPSCIHPGTEIGAIWQSIAPLDRIRVRKGTGAIGHPEARDLESKR